MTETRGTLLEEIKFYSSAIWLNLLFVAGAFCMLDFAVVVMISIWIVPLDALQPLKIAFIGGYLLAVGFGVSRLRPLFVSEDEPFGRIFALLFLPLTLLSLYGVFSALPEVYVFLVGPDLPFVFPSPSLVVKVAISVVVFVLLVAPLFYLVIMAPFNLGNFTRVVVESRKKLRGMH